MIHKAEIVDQLGTVCMTAKHFAELQTANPTKTLTLHRGQFEQKYSAWLTEQNQRFDAHGLWCDDLLENSP